MSFFLLHGGSATHSQAELSWRGDPFCLPPYPQSPADPDPPSWLCWTLQAPPGFFLWGDLAGPSRGSHSTGRPMPGVSGIMAPQACPADGLGWSLPPSEVWRGVQTTPSKPSLPGVPVRTPYPPPRPPLPLRSRVPLPAWLSPVSLP